MYPLLAEAMSESGLQEVETYVDHHQNTVAQYIVTSLFMELCLVAEGSPGTRMSKWWWEQEFLDLEGVRTEDWTVELEDIKGRGGGGEEMETG